MTVFYRVDAATATTALVHSWLWSGSGPTDPMRTDVVVVDSIDNIASLDGRIANFLMSVYGVVRRDVVRTG